MTTVCELKHTYIHAYTRHIQCVGDTSRWKVKCWNAFKRTNADAVTVPMSFAAHTRIHIHTQQQSDFISETISVEPDEFTYLYLYTQFLFINTNKLYHPQSGILLRQCTHRQPLTSELWVFKLSILYTHHNNNVLYIHLETMNTLDRN